MTQVSTSITVRHLDTDKDLGMFTTHSSALDFCRKNNLTPVAAPHGFKFESPLPLPDSPTNLVMFVFSGEKLP